MAFLVDTQELKPGLIVFRRGDVKHRGWYCRIKLPSMDRYKTVSLKTADVNEAKERAFDHGADLRFRIKHEVRFGPMFAAEIRRKRVQAMRQHTLGRWNGCEQLFFKPVGQPPTVSSTRGPLRQSRLHRPHEPQGGGLVSKTAP